MPQHRKKAGTRKQTYSSSTTTITTAVLEAKALLQGNQVAHQQDQELAYTRSSFTFMPTHEGSQQIPRFFFSRRFSTVPCSHR